MKERGTSAQQEGNEKGQKVDDVAKQDNLTETPYHGRHMDHQGPTEHEADENNGLHTWPDRAKVRG